MGIRERLVARTPGSTGFRFSIALIQMSIGDVLMAQGDLAGALERFDAAWRNANEQANGNQSNDDIQYVISLLHVRSGRVEERRGDPTAAIKAYERGARIAQSLADGSPGNPEFQSHIESTRQRLEELRRAAGLPLTKP